MSRHLQHACGADTLHMDCCSPIVQPFPCPLPGLATAELIHSALAPAIVAGAAPGVGLSQLLCMPLHEARPSCRLQAVYLPWSVLRCTPPRLKHSDNRNCVLTPAILAAAYHSVGCSASPPVRTPPQLSCCRPSFDNVRVDTLCTTMLQPQVQYLSDAEVDIDTDEEDDMEDYVGESGSDSEDEGRQNGAAEQTEPLKGSGSQRRAAAPGHRAPAKRRAGASCGWVCERPARQNSK